MSSALYDTFMSTVSFLINTPMIPPEEASGTRTVPLTEFHTCRPQGPHSYPPVSEHPFHTANVLCFSSFWLDLLSDLVSIVPLRLMLRHLVGTMETRCQDPSEAQIIQDRRLLYGRWRELHKFLMQQSPVRKIKYYVRSGSFSAVRLWLRIGYVHVHGSPFLFFE